MIVLEKEAQERCNTIANIMKQKLVDRYIAGEISEDGLLSFLCSVKCAYEQDVKKSMEGK